MWKSAKKDKQDEPNPAGDKPSNKANVDMEKLPAVVSNVNFEGVRHASGALLTKQARQLFTDVTNFKELVEQANLVRERLEQLNLFKDVSYFIDVDRTQKGSSQAYDVTYNLTEKSRLNISLTTMASLENRPSLVLRGSVLNTLGTAEHVEANLHCGTNWDLERFLTVTAPLEGAPHIKSTIGVSDTLFDMSWLRLLERSSSAFFGVKWPTFAGVHSLRMECSWRELSPGREFRTSAMPLSIRSECGHYLRGAFRHTFERDMRDNPILPSRGWMVRVAQLFASGGGGFQQTHVSHEMEAHWCRVIRENIDSGSCISVQLTAGYGLIRSLPGSGRVSVVDRFFLGGPLHLRGFELKQVGDHTEDGSCPTGASSYVQGGAHAYSTLPFIGGRGLFKHIRLHAFTTAACMSRREPIWCDGCNLFSLLSRETRLSAGLGVACQLAGVARLEVNYCWPMLARAGDRVHPGLQFGIGFNFL